MGKHGELLETVKIREMAKCVETMLEKSLDAFNEENSAQAGMVFTMDNQVDNIYFTSFELLSKYVAEHPADALYVLHLGTVLRKIERSGDHCNNIMEEIVFYLDARVLKHQKKDK
ncbi:Phosphate-specific transport system accessory protein PhoU [bioreactor metagenome]|uniref:Phosphate-specific transport system accessory protein PhoU n=1 Tax=bioreactor metagenome TaxID=1076179 RepID=A0A645F3U9_9ZZZZ